MILPKIFSQKIPPQDVLPNKRQIPELIKGPDKEGFFLISPLKESRDEARLFFFGGEFECEAIWNMLF